MPSVICIARSLNKKEPLYTEWVQRGRYEAGGLPLRLGNLLGTRGGHDWSAWFARICNALEALPIESAIFDGELAMDVRNKLELFITPENNRI